MSDSSTVDTVSTAIGVGSLGFGALALLAPDVLTKVYGMGDDVNPSLRYMGRMWGSRTAFLGVLTLAADDDQRQALSIGGAAMNAADTLAVLGTSGLPARTKAMAAMTTAAFCAAALYVATSD